mmetsp:Transcript_7875/g.17350  ORF Transcript_7875/g.17350 Transcript_7875/m.17350 type:complete len:200 (-) Transcript_7875:580-1179(-)
MTASGSITTSLPIGGEGISSSSPGWFDASLKPPCGSGLLNIWASIEVPVISAIGPMLRVAAAAAGVDNSSGLSSNERRTRVRGLGRSADKTLAIGPPVKAVREDRGVALTGGVGIACSITSDKVGDTRGSTCALLDHAGPSSCMGPLLCSIISDAACLSRASSTSVWPNLCANVMAVQLPLADACTSANASRSNSQTAR